MELSPILSEYPMLRISRELPKRISGFSADSKKIKPGYIYICIRGDRVDGHQFAQEAIRHGAQVVVAERMLQLPVPVICVTETRHFLSFFADRFYGQPSRKLKIIGITGTNGKTTTAHFLYHIYKQAGIKAALLGTVGMKAGGRYLKQNLTTPGAEELHRTLWELARNGIRNVAMEVSSHALVQRRVEHCRFNAAVFTNLTRDHLDYHGSMDRYFQAKAHLFTLLSQRRNAYAIINADDPQASRLQAYTRAPVWTFGVQNAANIHVREIISLADGGSYVRVDTPHGQLSLLVHLHGLFNIYNAVAAASVALAEGVSPQDVALGIESLRHIPGRLERLPAPPGIRIYLDYAHTPDGLEKVLQTLTNVPHRKMILVFGCRGNRDRGKRPQMGKVAERYADMVILTADNPEYEDPLEIASEIASEMHSKPLIIPDREQAIHYALQLAKEGDLILLTGKGRENYQLLGDKTQPYSDMSAVTNYYKDM